MSDLYYAVTLHCMIKCKTLTCLVYLLSWRLFVFGQYRMPFQHNRSWVSRGHDGSPDTFWTRGR